MLHIATRIKDVSVYEDRREELEKHEFMMGVPRGRLAVTLDVLTDALVLVGQHGVYCQSARQPGKPAMDIQLITKSISDAKDLISGVMTELKDRPDNLDSATPARTDCAAFPRRWKLCRHGQGTQLYLPATCKAYRESSVRSAPCRRRAGLCARRFPGKACPPR